MRQCSTEFAQIDPVLLEFGLFKSLPRDGASSPLSLHRPFGGIYYTLMSPRTLEDLALKVLLVLCALAALSATAEKSSTSKMNTNLWDRLALSSHEPVDCAVWQGTVGDILREADMQSGGGNKDRVLDRLLKLSEVRISASDKTGKRLWQSNLISLSQSQNLGEVRVAFSPGLSARILRKQAVQYSHIRLEPMRATDCPAARILHAVLSNRIRVGNTASYRLGTLAEIVYCHSDNPADLRKRKSAVRAAIKELASSGWEFRQASSGSKEVFEIRHTASIASTLGNQMHLPLVSGHQLALFRATAMRPSFFPRRDFGFRRRDPLPSMGSSNGAYGLPQHMP